MKSDTLTINSSNRAPNKGLEEYKQEIDSYLISMRYEKVSQYHRDNNQLVREYTPRPRLKVMGGNIKIITDPYEIFVEAPIGVIRILESQLDLKKIFM